MERRHRMSKKYQVKEFAGEQVLFVVVADMDDELLLEHLEMGLNSEDYEYCEAVAAEATLRGLPIKKSISQYLNQSK